MPRRVYAGPWQRVRRRILDRDDHLCQIRAPGCTTIATDVDHIVPVDEGGAWYDEANLRAACGHCNTQRIGQQRSRRWQTATTHITLVVGPPGAGLLARVRAEAQASDLIVDHGAIRASLGGQDEAARSVRTALVEKLRQGRLATARAWITSHNPQAETLYPHHRVVLVELDPGAGGQVSPSSSEVDAWRRARAGEHAPVAASRAW